MWPNMRDPQEQHAAFSRSQSPLANVVIMLGALVLSQRASVSGSTILVSHALYSPSSLHTRRTFPQKAIFLFVLHYSNRHPIYEPSGPEPQLHEWSQMGSKLMGHLSGHRAIVASHRKCCVELTLRILSVPCG